MPWVEFTRDYDWRPPETVRIRIAFKAGMQKFVRRKCAEDAIKAGAAKEISRPSGEEFDGAVDVMMVN